MAVRFSWQPCSIANTWPKKVADAEREDVRLYNAALAAGWSAEELRKIGYAEPDKKARTRRHTARKPAAKSDGQAAVSTPPSEPADAAQVDVPAGAEGQPVRA